MDTSTARVLSLILALSVMAGAALLVVRGEPPRATPPAPGPHDPAAAAPEPSRSPPPRQAATEEAPPPAGLLYKCRGSGGTAYRDQGCQPGEQVLAVTRPSPTGDPAAAQAELARLKARVAEMADERRAREAAAARATPRRTTVAADNTARCEALLQEIAWIDGQLRQPHSASQGDWWTAQRKEKTDVRFSLGC